MKIECKWECIGYELGASNVQVHGYYKAKTKQKQPEGEKPRENGTIRTHYQAHDRASRAHDHAPLHHGRAPHHSQPVVATVPAGLAAPRTLRFDLFWTLIWATES